MAVEALGRRHMAHLKTYTNMNGNIPWTSETLDISRLQRYNVQDPFPCFGVDSYDINNWNIDNIYIVATDGSTGSTPASSDTTST